MSQTCNTYRTFPQEEKGKYITEIYQNGKLAARSTHTCVEGMTDIPDWSFNLTNWQLFNVTDIISLNKYLREITSEKTDLLLCRLYDEKSRRRGYGCGYENYPRRGYGYENYPRRTNLKKYR